MLAAKYLDKASALLGQLRDTQLDHIEQAGELIAESVAQGHTFYAWGGPHSSLPVQDIFLRAGGLTIVNGVFTPGMSLEVGPIRFTSHIERAEGLGRGFFGYIGAEEDDVILLVSTSGRNPFPIEMAMAAKQASLKVIGMTSMAYTSSVTSRHSSGKKMYEYCDVVLDNLTVPGDAILEDDKLPQKIGPTSGWMGCLILQALMAEVAERLADKGVTPPIGVAANVDGYEEYRDYIHNLRMNQGTCFGGTYSPRRGS